MSETLEQTAEVAQPKTVNFFDENQLSESPVQQSVQEVQETGTQSATGVQETAQTQTADTTADTNASTSFDPNQFIKNEFGYESLDEAKAEFENLKKLKEQEPQQPKFANEESETLYKAWLEGKKEEVLDYLSRQKKIEKLASAEVNSNTAEEIIKLNIQQKNKNLSDDEVDFAFRDKYSYPEKPTQSVDETDEEYEAKMAKWESQVQTINKRMIIDAKMVQPEIEKLKGELTLPEIQKANQLDEAAQQEELQQVANLRKSFEQALESEYKNFNGFSVTFKDESAGIEIPISYNPTDEEKVSLKTALSDFDHSEYFGNRWFTEEGKPQVQQMMADKYFLENKDKILQKVANEAAQQMRLKMLAIQSNVNLSNSANNQTFVPQTNQPEMDGLARAIFMA